MKDSVKDLVARRVGQPDSPGTDIMVDYEYSTARRLLALKPNAPVFVRYSKTMQRLLEDGFDIMVAGPDRWRVRVPDKLPGGKVVVSFVEKGEELVDGSVEPGAKAGSATDSTTGSATGAEASGDGYCPYG